MNNMLTEPISRFKINVPSLESVQVKKGKPSCYIYTTVEACNSEYRDDR